MSFPCILYECGFTYYYHYSNSSTSSPQMGRPRRPFIHQSARVTPTCGCQTGRANRAKRANCVGCHSGRANHLSHRFSIVRKSRRSAANSRRCAVNTGPSFRLCLHYGAREDPKTACRWVAGSLVLQTARFRHKTTCRKPARARELAAYVRVVVCSIRPEVNVEPWQARACRFDSGSRNQSEKCRPLPLKLETCSFSSRIRSTYVINRPLFSIENVLSFAGYAAFTTILVCNL